MYPFKKFSIGELRGINASQHKAVGDPLAYTFIIKPYCTSLQKIIPSSVAPNSITWLGFIAMATSFLVTMLFDPSLTNSRGCLPLLNALLTFIYLSTDSLDGIHARNTNQCSPLGKILDHFVDSIAVLFAIISLCSSFRTGYSLVTQALVVSIMLGFYVSQLSERYTGYMKFSLISGACEGLLGIICVHIISFLNPDLINTVLHSDHYLSKASMTNLFLAWAVSYVSYIFSELFRDISKQPIRRSFKYVAVEVIKPVIMVLMIIPLFKAGPQKSAFLPFSYLMVYGSSYSLCYLEDYISSMTKIPVDHSVFICSFLILGAQSIVYTIGQNAETATRVLFLISMLHFVIRSGSVLISLARILNTKLFTRSF